MTTQQLLAQSLEQVVERVGDPAPLVYQRLFERSPELLPMFVGDTRGSVRAEMFLRAIDTLTDLAGERHFAAGMIASEWSNHSMNGVSTRQFETFTETGIQLTSGQVLDADVVITATGFNLSALGDIRFTIDGAPLDFADTVTWRGTMFTGVPNMAWVFGYFRASWTLRADLIADLVCRLLQHMEARGASVVTPTLRAQDQGMPLLPWVDPQNFNPGYLARGMALLPHQGDRMPWRQLQDYAVDKDELPCANLDDGALVYR